MKKVIATKSGGEEFDLTQDEIKELRADNILENAVIKNTQYALSRRKAYGSIGNQLDMQYWDRVNGTNKWENHIRNVKKRYPKPINEKI